MRDAWRKAVAELHRTSDGSPSTGRPLLRLVADAPSRPPANTTVDTLLRQAAIHLLATVPPLTATELATQGVSWHNAPELSALAVVDLTELDTDEEHWAGWAIALACSYTGDSTVLAPRLLAQCSARASARLAPLLTQTLQHASAPTVLAAATAFADQPAASQAVLDWAEQPSRTPGLWHAAISALAAAAHSEAIGQLKQVLQADPRVLDADDPAYQQWMLAAHTAVSTTATLHLWHLVQARLDTPAIRADFFGRLADDYYSLAGQPLGSLPEQELAGLFDLIARELDASVPAADLNPSNRKRLTELLHSIPSVLATHATTQAATELLGLASRHPDIWYFARPSHATARAAAEKQLQPIPPRGPDPTRRLDQPALGRPREPPPRRRRGGH